MTFLAMLTWFGVGLLVGLGAAGMLVAALLARWATEHEREFKQGGRSYRWPKGRWGRRKKGNRR